MAKWKTRNVSDDYYVGDKLTSQHAVETSLVTDRKTYQKFYCKKLETKLLQQGHDRDHDQESQETKIMKKLTGEGAHSNIVKLKEVIREKDSENLIMEWCPGGDLFDRIENRFKGSRYSEREAAILFQQILTAVAYCHSKGVMHLDLRPETLVFLSSDEDPQIPGERENFPLKATDFGHSVAFETNNPENVVQIRKLVGSAYYIAPEVLKRKYGPKADVWSAGVILYILLSGVPPFWAVDEPGILDSVLKGKLDFISEPWPARSKEAKQLLKRMLHKDPKKRISASEALEHEWMKKNGEPNYSTILDQFKAVDELKKVVLSIMEKEVSELKTMFEKMVEGREARDKVMDKKVDSKKTVESRDKVIKVKEFKEDLENLTKVSVYISGVKTSLKKAAMHDVEGTIDENEFITGTMHILMEEYVSRGFDCDDKQDGRITRKLLEKVLNDKLNDDSTKNKKKIDDQTIQKVFAAAGKENDVEIHYKELVEVIKKNPDSVPKRWRTVT